MKMQDLNKPLYGVAYYDEYMPYDRLQEDVQMMKKAGIDLVRIAESTWSTCEPADGVFDFSHVTRVMDAMEEAGIHVIIGTPSYAVPAWLVKKHPNVLAVTKAGRGMYGPRQIMDITDPDYLFHCERVIRELMKVTAHRKCVIGFQLDNETKYYGTAGENVQQAFVEYLKDKFDGSTDALNKAFGLDYWSNRVDDWADFPDVRGTINGSLGAEFEKFQRTLVDRFLQWQADIVGEYKREDQFLTQNFDFEWRGYSYGIQPNVNQIHAAKAVTVAGCDIYYPNQDGLTGTEIAFGGDVTRSLKQDNYLVLETEAQGFPDWTPYDGQLRLGAFSHYASGANCVEYWHWHSIHNAAETYWKGLLSHDFKENATYREACTIGADLQRFGDHIVNLEKKNKVAIMVSNESLTALQWFPIQMTARSMVTGYQGIFYNDVIRWIYDTLYKMNVECDIIWPETEDLQAYQLIFVPAMYCMSDETSQRLKDFVHKGGTLAATFKTGFADENVKVYHDGAPHGLQDVLGIDYHQFTLPVNVGLAGELYEGNCRDEDEKPLLKEAEAAGQGEAKNFMELLLPQGAEVLAHYAHGNWGKYAAITEHSYGEGKALYLGCMTDEVTLSLVVERLLLESKIEKSSQQFPIIIKSGTNSYGRQVHYYFNYSGETKECRYEQADGTELCTGTPVQKGQTLELPGWGFCIVEENKQ